MKLKVLKNAAHICLLIFLVLFAIFYKFNAYAQTPTLTLTPTPAPTSASDNSKEVQDLQNQINDLQGKISNLQGQEKTLASQIGVMDSQIQLTQLRIDTTKQQIASLVEDINTATKKISNLEKSLDMLTKVVLNRIVATYEVGSLQPFQVIFASNGISDFFSRLSYLRIAQVNDKKLIYETQQAKMDYANQKEIFENKKKKTETLKAQLESYTSELNQEKESKKSLLAQTQGDEATYQKLLTQARAQLAGFSRFVSSQGGASILSNQTVCDGWGCYYNQRDSQWGNILINGQNDCDGPCSVARVGCLITSVAMVASHKGHKDILPSSIANSSGDNFSVNTAMLKYSINVNGVSINRSRIGSSWGVLPGTITDPIIVGVSYDGGPVADHFVVLTGGSNGNYTMNDPFVPSAHNIPFTDHYSLGSIVEVDTVSM
ncbi:MAG: hypothetical protein HYT83_00785 [Candidatus Levybacteria bacterium]|nr:hypothetical protein [Candidatus Levybacteria bacterium]